MWENTFVLLFDYLVSTRAGNVIAVFLGALIFYFIFRLIVRIIDYIMFKRLVDGILDVEYDRDDERSYGKDKEYSKKHDFHQINDDLENGVKYNKTDNRYNSHDKNDKKSHVNGADSNYTENKFDRDGNKTEKNINYEKANSQYDQNQYSDKDSKKSSANNTDRDYKNEFDQEENENEKENDIKRNGAKNRKKRKIVGVAQPVGRWTNGMMRQWIRRNQNIDMNLMNDFGYFQALVDKQKKSQDEIGIGGKR